MMVTFELEAVQGLFEIVHAKTFTPSPNPVMVVFGNNEFVIIPDPEIKDHVPTPAVAVFAAMSAVGLLIQSVWLGPAFETEGI